MKREQEKKHPGVPQELIRFINEGEAFLVAGHKEPDGDCVGSQLALVSALDRMGKKAIAVTAGPFKRSEIKPFEKRFTPCPDEKDREGFRLIVVDCSSLERTGDLPLKGLPRAVLDHHEAEGPGGMASYLDPQAPSVTFMTLKLIEALGLRPTKEEAELLLFGLCTDTGFFRHVDEEGEETFLAASRLIAAGASPKLAFQKINGGKTLNSRLLTGLILSRTCPLFNGRLLLSFETYDDGLRFGGESRDSDTIYQLLMAIQGVEAAALIRQEKKESCTLGLRSKDRIDVASVAALFGGGGHKNAAGASVAGTIETVEPALIKAFEAFFV